MRVAMVTLFPDHPGHVMGGVAAVAVSLVRELAKIEGLGIEVVAFGSKLGERTARWEGVTVHYLPPETLPTVPLRVWWEQPRAVARKVVELGCDLAHVQGLGVLHAAVPGRRVLTLHGVPERTALHSGRGLNGRLRSLGFALVEGRARRRAENIIVISPYLRDVLGDQLRGRQWDIENPVDDAFFEVVRRPVPGRIFFCGMIYPLKNLMGLIEALALLRTTHPHAHLRVAGPAQDPDYLEGCRQRVRALDLGRHVEFIGPLVPAAVREELATASCLALCSFQETAPVAVEEAMAAGVPVVGARVGGIPYMIEDGQTGRLVDPREPTDIAAGLRAVLDGDPARMSARAVAVASRRFRASVVARRTYEVYQEVLAAS